MKNQHKHLNFFQEINNICKALGWADEQTFMGSTEKEIEEYEKEKGIKFGENWVIYLKNFGSKFDNLYYGIDSMKGADKTQYEENQDLDEGDEIINWVGEIENALSKLGDHKANNIILLNTLLESGAVQYIKVDDDDLSVCNFDIDQKKLGHCSPFKTIFRNYFYNKIFLKKEVSNKIEDRIPWLKYLEVIRMKFPGWHIPREEFYPIAHKKELEEGRIMGIDEFETKFIQFLIEKRGLKKCQRYLILLHL